MKCSDLVFAVEVCCSTGKQKNFKSIGFGLCKTRNLKGVFERKRLIMLTKKKHSVINIDECIWEVERIFWQKFFYRKIAY